MFISYNIDTFKNKMSNMEDDYGVETHSPENNNRDKAPRKSSQNLQEEEKKEEDGDSDATDTQFTPGVIMQKLKSTLVNLSLSANKSPVKDSELNPMQSPEHRREVREYVEQQI